MTFLFFSTLSAQVTIKERAEITPAEINKKLALGDSKIQVIITTNGVLNHNPNNPADLWSSGVRIRRVNDSCWLDQTVSLENGSATNETDALGGIYSITAAWHTMNTGGTADVYVDGVLISHQELASTTDVCPCGVSWNIGTFDLYTDYLFNRNADTIQPCGEATLSLAPSMTWCAVAAFDLLCDSITLTITNGSDYAQFISSEGIYSSSIKLQLIDAGNQVGLVSTGVRPPAGQYIPVTIQATGYDLLKETTIYIGSDVQPYSLIVNVDNASLESQIGSTSVTVAGYDSSWQEIWCDQNRLVTLTVDSTSYGSFLDLSGNRVVNNLTVSYSDARSGQIRYVADGEKACEEKTITMTASSPDMISGTTDFRIRPSEDCLITTLSSTNVSPGDTISITFHKQTFCNGIEDYPADQYFYAYVDEGPGYGKWIATENYSYLTDDYICDVQGFRFAVSDTINSDSLSIRLKFGISGGSSALSVKGTEARAISNVSSIINKLKAEQKKHLMDGETCDNPSKTVTIEKEDMCNKPSDIPACSQPNITTFSVVPEANNYMEIDACAEAKAENTDKEDVGGVFRPTKYFDYAKPISICYNESNQRYSFSSVSVNIHAIESTCSESGRELITYPSQVNAITDRTTACNDFRGHVNNPITANKYLLSEFIKAHEKKHREQYDIIVQKVKKEMIDNLPVTIHCSNLESRDELNAMAMKMIEARYQGCVDEINRRWVDKGSTTESEDNINNTNEMKKIINKWIEYLNHICLSCQQCLKYVVE